MNPEFRRQLWLQFSTTRLVLLPVLLMACFMAVFLSAHDNTAQALSVASSVLFCALALGVGTFSAGASVMDEITDRTWDQQRMSAMQPWAMTWGKLAGSTSYGWYGGALCLLVAVPSALVGDVRSQVLPLTLSALLAGVCLQAIVVAMNLQLVRVGGMLARRGALWAPVLVLLWGVGPLIGILKGADIEWWSHTFDKLDFTLASLILFTACALGAAWRSMAEVLAVRQLPWGWPTLALIATMYLTGFSKTERMLAFSLFGLGICAVFTYFALFAELQHRPMWQRVANRVQNGQWRESLLQLPRWPTTLFLALLFSVGVTANFTPDAALTWHFDKHITLQPMVFVLLMARDCVLALFLAFSPKGRRFGLSFSILMLVLYGLVPWLLSAAGIEWMQHLVQPLLASGGLSLVFGAIHLGVALGLLRWRWMATSQ